MNVSGCTMHLIVLEPMMDAVRPLDEFITNKVCWWQRVLKKVSFDWQKENKQDDKRLPMKPMHHHHHHHPNCKGCGAIKVVHRLDANHITLLDAFIITIDSFTIIAIHPTFSPSIWLCTFMYSIFANEKNPIRLLCMDGDDDDKAKASSSGGLDMLTFVWYVSLHLPPSFHFTPLHVAMPFCVPPLSYAIVFTLIFYPKVQKMPYIGYSPRGVKCPE